MKYKDFTIYYEIPFGRLEQIYNNLGILDLLNERKKAYDIPESAYLSCSLLACNSKTHEKLKQQLIYNWENYNYDRDTGEFKGKKLTKYRNRHPLSYSDKSCISWHFIDISPKIDDSIPDDIIRVTTEWDQDIIDKTIERYIFEKGKVL